VSSAAAALAPAVARARNGLGVALLRARRYEEARQCFEQAVALEEASERVREWGRGGEKGGKGVAAAVAVELEEASERVREWGRQ
jgi:tetratricopeptide (TPR) repeat protein